MTASWSAPIRVQPNTSVVRAIDRGQWQAPLGSSRGQPPDRRRACRRARLRQGQAFGGAEEAEWSSGMMQEDLSKYPPHFRALMAVRPRGVFKKKKVEVRGAYDVK